MKFAFIIMGQFDLKNDRASIHNGVAQIVGVSSVDEACTVAQELCVSGVDCIELCGAFGEVGTKKVINATQNKIPVGYVTHLPEQETVYKSAFSK
ncbi:DUF6506 family protein [Lacrimispora sp.]|uniref:DUF6506 family protein n=1 Tax=Lacrimispora sp. TaxID=2719234 RepID=UPI0032E41D0B